MERQIVFKIKGNNYVIAFPNVGKFQDVETMKQIVSKGMYSSLLSTATVSSMEVLQMIDMEAYFSVLCPKLLEDLKCKSFSDLDIEDYQELKKEYVLQFVPWWNSILDILSPKEDK